MTTRPFPCARCGGTAEHTPTPFDAERRPTWWTPEQTIGGAAVCARCFIASFDNEEKK